MTHIGPPIELADITVGAPTLNADVGVSAPEFSHTDRRGTTWWKGNGPPSDIPGSQAGDAYLDLLTGDAYWLYGDAFDLGG